MYNLAFTLLIISLSFFNCKKRDTTDTAPQQPVDIEARVIVQNRNLPWEILWGPDNFIWMTERSGQISRVNASNGAVTPVYTVPDVQAQGEGGLLGMALHPSFSANPYVYVVYNYSNGGSYREKVIRFTYDGTTLTAPSVLLDNIAAASIHNGSRLLILNDKLFITTGDAANQPLAQSTSSVNGKVLRINLDGSIPADNPLPNNPVWTWGHRNAQGLAMVGNKMFSSEHGPSNDDEINVIEKGRNYGWPNVHGICDAGAEQTFCNANNVKEPIKIWTPTIAPAGIEYYNSDLIVQWKNSLLMTTLKNSRLYQLKLNSDATQIVESQEFFTNTYGRLRDVCISPEGKVYICTSNGANDKIIEISKK